VKILLRHLGEVIRSSVTGSTNEVLTVRASTTEEEPMNNMITETPNGEFVIWRSEDDSFPWDQALELTRDRPILEYGRWGASNCWSLVVHFDDGCTEDHVFAATLGNLVKSEAGLLELQTLAEEALTLLQGVHEDAHSENVEAVNA